MEPNTGPRVLTPGCRVRPAGKSGRLEVETTFPFGQWVPRQNAHRALAGTPVLFEDRWYEVITAEVDNGGAWRYLLGPWPADESIRAPAELSAATAAAARDSFRSARRREDLAWAVMLLLPVVGSLPAKDQERIESELGIRASHATFASALLGLGLGVSGTLLMFLRARGHDLGLLANLFLLGTPFALVWVWLVPESLLRLGARDPVGSLPMALPVAAVGVLRRAFASRKEALQTGSSRPRAKTPAAADEVRRFAADDPATPQAEDGTPIAIEIATPLEREDWVLQTTGVVIEGLVYRLVGRRTENRQGRKTWVYSLEVPEESANLRRVLEWHPHQLSQLALEATRRERGLWVEPLAPLWGLLDRETQEQIGAAYDYRPDWGTATSVVSTAIVGFAALLTVRSHFSHGIGGWDDLALIVLGGWCLLEVVLRVWNLRRGIHVPSAFAPLAAPLARRALR